MREIKATPERNPAQPARAQGPRVGSDISIRKLQVFWAVAQTGSMTRAARLLEQMEQAGLVTPMQANGNREILVKGRPDDDE